MVATSGMVKNDEDALALLRLKLQTDLEPSGGTGPS